MSELSQLLVCEGHISAGAEFISGGRYTRSGSTNTRVVWCLSRQGISISMLCAFAIDNTKTKLLQSQCPLRQQSFRFFVLIAIGAVHDQ